MQNYTPKILEALNHMFETQHGCAVVVNNVNIVVNDFLPNTEEGFKATKEIVFRQTNALWMNAVLAMAIMSKLTPVGAAFPAKINGFDVVTQPAEAAMWLLLNDADKWASLYKNLELLQQKYFNGNSAALTVLAHSTKYANYGWKYSNLAARDLFDSLKFKQ